MRQLTAGFVLTAGSFFVINMGVQLGVGYWLLNQLDLRFEAWTRLLLVPATQASVLWLAIYGGRIGRAVRQLMHHLVHNSTLLYTLLLDLAVLIGALTFADRPWADLHNNGSIPVLFMALKAIGASLMLLFLVLRRPAIVHARTFVVGAGFLMLFGLDYFVPWSRFLVGLLPEGTPIFLDFVVYGCLYLAALTVLLRASSACATFSPESGLLLSVAGLFSAVAIPFLGVARFESTFLPSPWHSATKSLNFLAVSAIWLSILTVQRHLKERNRQPVTSGG